jgi:hypothetical protein
MQLPQKVALSEVASALGLGCVVSGGTASNSRPASSALTRLAKQAPGVTTVGVPAEAVVVTRSGTYDTVKLRLTGDADL